MEETLASYLSPESSSSIKSPILPNKPVKITSALWIRLIQHSVYTLYLCCKPTRLNYQQIPMRARVLVRREFAELHRATDLSLRAAKETAKSIGRSMAALVATERYLWLNLITLKETLEFH